MATYKLSYDKMKQLERVVGEYPAYKFKIISKKLYDENFKLLKEHYLNLNFGKIMLSKLTSAFLISSTWSSDGSLPSIK